MGQLEVRTLRVSGIRRLEAALGRVWCVLACNRENRVLTNKGQGQAIDRIVIHDRSSSHSECHDPEVLTSSSHVPFEFVQ